MGFITYYRRLTIEGVNFDTTSNLWLSWIALIDYWSIYLIYGCPELLLPVVPGLTRNPSLSIDSRLRGNDGEGRHYAVNSVVSNLFRTFSPPVRALNYHCVGYIIYGCPELLRAASATPVLITVMPIPIKAINSIDMIRLPWFPNEVIACPLFLVQSREKYGFADYRCQIAPGNRF